MGLTFSIWGLQMFGGDPERTQVGHAGAITEAEEGNAERQIAAFEKAWATIARSSLNRPALKMGFRGHWHRMSK